MTSGAIATSVGGAGSAVRVLDGVCLVYFAYDVATTIRLDEAQRLIGAGGERKVVVHKRRTPGHLGYLRPPLRVVEQAAPIRVGAAGEWATRVQVECLVFEFGAISVMYTIPLVENGKGGAGAQTVDGVGLDELARLSDALYENQALKADSKRRVEGLIALIGPSIKKPLISPMVEDYAVFHLKQVECAEGVPGVVLGRERLTASILRGEPAPLSAQEVEDALSCRISYGPDDLTLIDWNASLVLGREMDDVLAVLEYANVELLEMRYLDAELDRALERARLRPPSTWWRRLVGLGPGVGDRPLRFIADLQVDAATLFEEVNNSLKMLGDQYLARVYRLASQRLHLSEWDGSILRKLSTLESIYGKMHDYETTRRLELLEWIVIILIAFEVVMSLVRY